MKILYCDVNLSYLNPTANLFPALFRDFFCGAVFYGPGFSRAEDMAGGLRAFVDRQGPFDALIIGSNTSLMLEGEDADARVLRYQDRFTDNRADYASRLNFFKDLRTSIPSIPIKVKLISALVFDYYAANQRQIDNILHLGLGIIGPNHQFVLRLAELPDFALREKHFVRKKGTFSDAWYDFLEKNPERVLTALHFVGSHEFFHQPLDDRRYDIAVPGVEYVLRREAARNVSKGAFRVAGKQFFHLYRLANRLGLPVFSNSVLMRLYNSLFQQGLADTRCVYTARGGFGIPIRKFFEIPAAGGLMLCSPPNGFAQLGYVPGEHYISVEPEELFRELTCRLKDSVSQQIAWSGQRLTQDLHSAAARGAQIRQCLEAMVVEQYRRAYWDHGRFVVERKS
jgi:hypothetical protein